MPDLIEKQAEAAIAAEIEAAGITVDGVALNIRGFLLDDKPLSPAEEIELPALVIMSSPSIQAGYRSAIHEVPITVALATHYSDDKKRQKLANYYSQVRAVLEGVDFGDHLTGYRFISLTLDDSDSDLENFKQVLQLGGKFNAQLQATTTTTTTTTTT